MARERVLKDKKDKVTESHSLRQLLEARELDYVTRELSAVELQEQEWINRLKQTQRKQSQVLAKLDKAVKKTDKSILLARQDLK